MAQEAPIYDLVLLLSENAEDAQRKKILTDVQSAISDAGGSIERDDDWGRRPLSYEIRHQPDAEYHLLQFRAPPTLIEELSHTLRITDGVLRFRVIKVRPGTPPAPSSPPPVVVAAAGGHGGSGHASASSAGASEGAPSAAPAADETVVADADEPPAPAADEAPAPAADEPPAPPADGASAPAADGAPAPAADGAGSDAEDAGES